VKFESKDDEGQEQTAAKDDLKHIQGSSKQWYSPVRFIGFEKKQMETPYQYDSR
jgi:hypothetical protein